jgi:hypothetical protein
MKDNGSGTYGMASVNKNGQMVQSMRASGEIIRLKERENSFILMVTITKENGKMIKLTDMESFCT